MQRNFLWLPGSHQVNMFSTVLLNKWLLQPLVQAPPLCNVARREIYFARSWTVKGAFEVTHVQIPGIYGPIGLASYNVIVRGQTEDSFILFHYTLSLVSNIDATYSTDGYHMHFIKATIRPRRTWMCSIPSFFYSAVASPIHIVQLNLPLLPSFTYMHTYTNDDDHGHTLILVKKEMLEAPSTTAVHSALSFNQTQTQLHRPKTSGLSPHHTRSCTWLPTQLARHKFGSRGNGTATCSYCVLKLTSDCRQIIMEILCCQICENSFGSDSFNLICCLT